MCWLWIRQAAWQLEDCLRDRLISSYPSNYKAGNQLSSGDMFFLIRSIHTLANKVICWKDLHAASIWTPWWTTSLLLSRSWFFGQSQCFHRLNARLDNFTLKWLKLISSIPELWRSWCSWQSLRHLLGATRATSLTGKVEKNGAKSKELPRITSSCPMFPTSHQAPNRDGCPLQILPFHKVVRSLI